MGESCKGVRGLFQAVSLSFKKYYLLLPIFLSLTILLINANKPFIGHHDFVGAMQGSIAKNYYKHGFFTLKFGQTPDPIKDVKNHISFYTNYLPLMPVLITFSYYFLGINEFAVRVVPITLSIISLLFFILIIEKLWDKKTALFGSLFFIFNPMFIYFGKLPAPEIGVILMSLVTIYLYLLWLNKQRFKLLCLMFLSILIGGLFGWPIVYIGPLIVIHSILSKKFNKKILLILVATILVPILQFLHIYILYGEISSKNLEPLRNRLLTSSLSFGGEDFTFLNYLKQQISWLQAYYTRIGLILSAISLLFLLRIKRSSKEYLILLFLMFGLAHLILFSQYVFVHDFLNIYLLPFFALSAALGLLRFLHFFKSNQIKAALLILIMMLFFTERIEFSKTLLLTSFNKQGKEVATILNTLQDQDDQVVIISERFQSFYGIFAKYYSNFSYRVIEEKDLTSLKETDKYLIFFDEDIRDRNLYNRLVFKNSYRKINDLTIVFLKK